MSEWVGKVITFYKIVLNILHKMVDKKCQRLYNNDQMKEVLVWN